VFLKISAGIGFGYFVLSETAAGFSRTLPDIDVSLYLTSRSVDLVAEGIDVTIRMGRMADSRLVTTGLGTMQRYLCAHRLICAAGHAAIHCGTEGTRDN